MSDEKNRSLAMRLIEKQQGMPMEEVLSALYSQGLSQKDIAHRLEVPVGTLRRWEDELKLVKTVTCQFPTRELVA